MSSIDDAIAKGKKRRKGVAIASLIGLAAVLVVYFGWLFLTKGYAFAVSPERAAQNPQFAVLSGSAMFISDKLRPQNIKMPRLLLTTTRQALLMLRSFLYRQKSPYQPPLR